ncbi:unnamed protein product [Angiostrongylus costaricensis]|uniref:SPASM domain-containing protein n=1 Tax=Angiostrongylus costaricensis TaxID=334426 RepID=A0A0R3PRL2_ANGCS|nr:unnamed protein product [Angiostrongylus costaricensis]
MFIVPIHVSPRYLFGGSEFVNGMPITRIGAEHDCNAPFHEKNQKELIEEGFEFEPFKVSVCQCAYAAKCNMESRKAKALAVNT